MCFCGYNKKDTTKIAAYFGMVEGLITLIMECFLLEVYFATPVRSPNEAFSKRYVLQYMAEFFNPGIQVLLICLAVLNCIWIVSSFLLLKGNAMDSPRHVKRWVIFTCINMTLDVIIPGILTGTTMLPFLFNAISRSEMPKLINSQLSPEFQLSSDDIRIALVIYYVIFCVTVTRFGPVLLIVNIILTVITNRRLEKLNEIPGRILSRAYEDTNNSKPLKDANTHG